MEGGNVGRTTPFRQRPARTAPRAGAPLRSQSSLRSRVRSEGHPLAGLSLHRSTHPRARGSRSSGGHVFFETVIVGNFDE